MYVDDIFCCWSNRAQSGRSSSKASLHFGSLARRGLSVPKSPSLFWASTGTRGRTVTLPSSKSALRRSCSKKHGMTQCKSIKRVTMGPRPEQEDPPTQRSSKTCKPTPGLSTGWPHARGLTWPIGRPSLRPVQPNTEPGAATSPQGAPVLGRHHRARAAYYSRGLREQPPGLF